MSEYRKPSLLRIGRSPATEKLYSLEDAFHSKFRSCVEEWCRLMNISDRNDLFRIGYPQGAYDFLHSIDQAAALLSAQAFLEYFGYQVTKPKEAVNVETESSNHP